MQRRCPAGVPDAMAVTLLVLLLLLSLLLLETVWSWKANSPEHDEKSLSWPENVVLLKSALVNFKDGCSWFGGFLMSLAALQTGALLVVEKSTDVEVAVWLVATLPAFLSPAAAFFFGFLLCKQQLAHACLERGHILTDLPRTEYLHKVLFVLLILYGMLVVFLTGLPMAALAIPALAGPCWALAKALNTARVAGDLQEYVEVDLRRLAEKPQIHEVPWGSFVKASRSGHPPFEKMIGADDSSFKVGDLKWHRHLVRSLTGSSAGFFVAPAFAAFVVLSWVITAVHMTSYACSQGELSNLQLATSDMVHFKPWQPHYEVILDVSFRQVALQAMSQASNTRSITFQQPAPAVGVSGDTTNRTITEKLSGATVEIQLSQRMVPRVAAVGVQGLRSSLPTTFYKIRFSPLVTLPVLLRIRSGDFTKNIAWSTLPGSILSVPEGFDDFMFEVYLADFVLGIPEDLEARPSNTLWTAFQPLPDPKEDKCAEHCKHDMRCFTHYVGQRGCFYAYGDHQRLEAGKGPAFRRGDSRNVTGRLSGCSQKNDSGIKEAAATEFLKFQDVLPDWLSTSASLGFSLHLAIGEQDHEAETIAIQLQKGSPSPMDAVAVLMGKIGSKHTILNSITSVDKTGDITLKIFEYDPREVQHLYVLLLPILPDKDFHTLATGVLDAAEEDLTVLRSAPKCLSSAYIRGRYSIRGYSKHLDDRPFKIPLDEWTGQPQEPVKLQTVPRLASKSWRNSSQKFAILFDGVDSPVACAAQRNGCDLLNEARTALAASANATCQVLQQNCTNDVCKLLDEDGLGGKLVRSWIHEERSPALLNPVGIVEVLSCQQDLCSHKYSWDYTNGVLTLDKHSAQVGLIEVVKKAVEPQGMDVFTAIHANLFKQSIARFRAAVASDLWMLPTVSPDLLLAVAKFSKEMPQALLTSWLRSAAALPENGAAAGAFQKLTELKISATNAQQLQRVPLLLSLAPNVSKLSVTCVGCPAAPATWPSWPQAPQIRQLVVEHFNLRTLPEDAFGNLTGLKWLYLNANHLQTLPKEIFQNLTGLRVLDLQDNHLQTLPTEIFQNLTELWLLVLRDNHLQTLPTEIFQNLKELKELFLDYNHLQTLPTEIFQNLKGLEKLYLSRNHLQTLPKEIFQNLTELERLDLRDNPGLEPPAVCNNTYCDGP